MLMVVNLSSLGSVPTANAAVTATNSNGNKLLFGSSVAVSAKKFTIRAETNTVYSTVVSGVVL